VSIRTCVTPCALGVGNGVLGAGLALSVALVVELSLTTLLAGCHTSLVGHRLSAGRAAGRHCSTPRHTQKYAGRRTAATCQGRVGLGSAASYMLEVLTAKPGFFGCLLSHRAAATILHQTDYPAGHMLWCAALL
jgi:hypothetical protein